jgi:trans-aconitate methyltransferase
MGGKGNGRDILAAADKLITDEKWRSYFDNFSFPLLFCSPDEYRQWLTDAGLSPKRLEIIPKDMAQKGREGLAGWIRTTWQPYTERIPESRREDFIDDLIDLYGKSFPIDNDGLFHIKMVRLEIEANNP